MERRDYIWVAIRVFGIYLLIEMVTVIPLMVSAALQTCQYREPTEALLTHLRAATVSHLVQTSLQVLLYGLVGTYLTFGGTRLFHWICPPEDRR